jgi:hypothetical protein
MAMLIFSLVATACIICLTILGRGNIMSGLNNVWKGVKKVSTIASSIGSFKLPHLKMFKTSILPTDRDVDPKQEGEAPSEGPHDLNSTSAAISM